MSNLYTTTRRQLTNLTTTLLLLLLPGAMLSGCANLTAQHIDASSNTYSQALHTPPQSPAPTELQEHPTSSSSSPKLLTPHELNDLALPVR